LEEYNVKLKKIKMKRNFKNYWYNYWKDNKRHTLWLLAIPFGIGLGFLLLCALSVDLPFRPNFFRSPLIVFYFLFAEASILPWVILIGGTCKVATYGKEWESSLYLWQAASYCAMIIGGIILGFLTKPSDKVVYVGVVAICLVFLGITLWHVLYVGPKKYGNIEESMNS
jgi:hypothetical protein